MPEFRNLFEKLACFEVFGFNYVLCSGDRCDEKPSFAVPSHQFRFGFGCGKRSDSILSAIEVPGVGLPTKDHRKEINPVLIASCFVAKAFFVDPVHHSLAIRTEHFAEHEAH